MDAGGFLLNRSLVCFRCVASNASLWYVPLAPSTCTSVTGLMVSAAHGFSSRFESCAGSVRKEYNAVNPCPERLQVSLDTLDSSNQQRVDCSVLQDARS